MNQSKIAGLYVPLITPLYKGKIDVESLNSIVSHLDAHVDGFVPCLSSGEGALLTDTQWLQVAVAVITKATKPVYTGILRPTIDSTVTLALEAKKLGADGIAVPVKSNNDIEIQEYFIELSKRQSLPIIIYNTEEHYVQSIETVKKLASIESVIAIKDSSDNIQLFDEMCSMRTTNDLRISVLQGMEHRLKVPNGCDGYMISLLNVEPEICRVMLDQQSDKVNEEILELFSKYNLGGEWFVSLKAILHTKGVITSCEQVEQSITLE